MNKHFDTLEVREAITSILEAPDVNTGVHDALIYLGIE